MFAPLLENKDSKKTNRPPLNRRQLGPKSVNSQSPHEIRRAIIERYISRWRKEVGNDFYPALRLILPHKDRDRAMYGLKEKYLARMLVKILKIDKNSDDGYNLLNWKQPARGGSTRGAGDFPGRAYEIFTKRPFRTDPGDMTIQEVNDLLDKLSRDAREEHQIPILETFCRRMSPDELKWLISIVLRTMHVGATERTFLNIWHPDAEALFNVTSSLRRVCWELWSREIRLEGNDKGVNLFECYQPQLAAFQPRVMKSITTRMKATDEDPVFWIEEKLDGERIQLHMRTEADEEARPKRVFKFWSRKAKDYTYLYGEHLDDDNSALSRHLNDAFDSRVDNIILDGEMITWDMETDRIVPFGTLKTAALEQQRNPFASGPRPLYRAFDIVLLNSRSLVQYTLRDRRRALEASVRPVERRLEIIDFKEGRTWDDIEAALRQVVAEASEGLVVKNPRSPYTLNDRNDDWVKVKPEYMQEFGESLDCVVIGGYYGSGKRGGGLSSFLCGLRLEDKITDLDQPVKHLSFFKVGGGLTANDYANIKHHTESKWMPWDTKNPPSEWIELGGGYLQKEKPDVWIKPQDSVVVQVKAASVTTSDEFAVNLTLRFPRFQRLRSDKDWRTALSMQEFLEVRDRAETEKAEHEKAQNEKMKAETRKRHQRTDLRKQPPRVVGYAQKQTNAAMADARHIECTTNVFQKCTIYVMTESVKPQKKTKLELEELIKAHGGRVVQTAEISIDSTEGRSEVICIASRKTVKVVSLLKKGNVPILRPIWIFDCIQQAHVDRELGRPALLLRPEAKRHVFSCPHDQMRIYEDETDIYGDSFTRDVSSEELKEIMSKMDDVDIAVRDSMTARLLEDEMPGSIFSNINVGVGYTDTNTRSQELQKALRIMRFGGAVFSPNLEPGVTTHVLVSTRPHDGEGIREVRDRISSWQQIPRLVTSQWVLDSWNERTRLDEERYIP